MRSLMLALALCGAPALAQAASPAITDPAPDPAHPPRSQQVLIPTPTAAGPDEMNALFYLAGGPAPHPTMILFHGFPGNEQNLDLAQAVRRDGWNVLTLHYRGSWGSPGRFSVAHVLEDARAAYAFVEDPARAARYGIDRAHVVVAGHSMGGFAAASVARDAPRLAGVVLIDAWDAGADGAKFARLDPATRKAEARKRFDDLGHSLAGTSEAAVADEIAAHAKAWDVLDWAP
jgi:pimeloyl-ACP methyl ester carboxylesterase